MVNYLGDPCLPLPKLVFPFAKYSKFSNASLIGPIYCLVLNLEKIKQAEVESSEKYSFTCLHVPPMLR